MLLLAWGAAPARANTTIIDTPVTGPLTVNAGDTLEIHTGGAVTSAADGVIVKAGGELIILDGSISVSGQSSGVFIDGGTVTMSGGTISASFTGVVFNNTGEMTLSGGSVTATHAVIVNGGSSLKVSGGAISGSGDTVIVNDGLVNISGGTLNGTPNANNFGVSLNGGVTTISGGSISAKIDGVSVGPGAVANISGGAILGPASASNTGVHVEGGTATVSGGSISGKIGVVVSAGTATISRGTVAGTDFGLQVTGGAATLSGGSVSGSLLGLEVTGGTATVSGCNLLLAGHTLLGILQDGTVLTIPASTSAPGQIVLNSAATQITCPANQTALATSAAGATVTFPTSLVTNTCGGPATVTCQPASGATFPLGDTSVACTVADAFGNSSACHFTVTVLPAADVAVSISAASGKSSGNSLKVNSQQSLTYTIVVLNGGPSSADGVAVQDILPDSFVFQSATTSQGTLLAPAAGATGALTANLGTLAAHGSATVRVTGSFRARKTTISNTAIVNTSATDPNPANNQATTNVTVN
jgi:uncharacterized repeat protein (TIGR01451 family)